MQQVGDNEMDEGDLTQPQDEAFSPHGAESEISSLLPMRLNGRENGVQTPRQAQYMYTGTRTASSGQSASLNNTDGKHRKAGYLLI